MVDFDIYYDKAVYHQEERKNARTATECCTRLGARLASHLDFRKSGSLLATYLSIECALILHSNALRQIS